MVLLFLLSHSPNDGQFLIVLNALPEYQQVCLHGNGSNDKNAAKLQTRDNAETLPTTDY